MPVRQIKRRPPDNLDPLLHHYLGQRMLRERSEDEEKRDKSELMEILTKAGEESVEGHRSLPVEPDAYTTAKGEQKTVKGIRRQRSVTQVLDEEATMKLLKKKKLLERCTKTVTVLSEDDVLACNYEGLISDKELAALYEETENFSFWLVYE